MSSRIPIFVLICGVALASLSLRDGQAQTDGAASQKAGVLKLGRENFESRCAGCHGLDGRGGERGPDIARRESVQGRTDEELTRIVLDGVPGTGMPAFRTMEKGAAKSVVGYLRLLQGRRDVGVVRGNAERGRELFFGKAGCSGCHMVKGQGGFLAADLSGYSRLHSLEEMREAIVAPQEGARGGVVEVRTREGKSYSGVVRNEDNFSLQLQTIDGTFHFLGKADVEEVSRKGLLMPDDYRKRLSAGEIEDVVSFLVRVGGAPRKAKKEEEFEE